ncbi:T9SS type A sorting domain-containing protein [Hymenobacter sp. DH14]|uniref:T9SS type A sorting domain-containing protein n=1 Tax=Hymenobacter cyanobacteriorum TaxID=2926463 RepID=A0A9X1VI65_9BACT|nr:T9SS type A sorting domain-containing protein [Hymenobacter cyanobacteriorum]MCI1189629.1 T9SS type A sorting domain-containing protein [Hymenobacter cyanobacteriorum]
MALAIGSTNTYVSASAADANGNVYLAGRFQGTIALGANNLTSAGGTDAFVAKWNSASSSFVWAQRAGGTSDDAAAAIAVSGTSIYIAGNFIGTASFGSTISVSTAGYKDAFVAKLTDIGSTTQFIWVQQAGGTNADYANALAVNGNSIYVTGAFVSPIATFGSLTLSNAAARFQTVFVAKLTDAGPASSFTWVKQAGGMDNDDYPTALAVQGANVYIAGRFYSSYVFFGIGSAAGPNHDSGPGAGGTADFFVAKLLDNGGTASFAWAQFGGGSHEDYANAITVAGTSVYVGGGFRVSGSFGSLTLSTPFSTNAPLHANAFVAKLAEGTGAYTWVQQAGGVQDDVVNSLLVNGASLYAAGQYVGTPQYPAVFGNSSLVSVGSNDTMFNNYSDVFVSKLTDTGASGSFVWAQGAGGSGTDVAAGLVASGTSLYVTGYLAPPASFGGHSIATPVNGNVGFLASLNDLSLTATVLGRRSESINLFPNPAHGMATIQLPALPDATTATLTILDALGRTLRIQAVAANAKNGIDLNGLAPGLYAVRVQAGGSTATRRLVVE